MAISSKSLGFVGYAIRGIVPFLYILWIVIGYSILLDRQVNPSHLRYQAARDLSAGHRLQPGDFRFDPQIPLRDRIQLPPESELVGKYLLWHRFKDQTISLQDLATAPLINVNAGKLAYFFSLQNQMDLVDILNTDLRVAVYGKAAAVKDARVVSVVCSGPPPSSKCSAVLELSKEEVATISGHNKEDLRLVLQGDWAR